LNNNPSSTSLSQLSSQNKHGDYTNDLTSDDYLDGDTGERFVRFAGTYGKDPHPEYHNVHFMAEPEFMGSTWHGYPPKGWSPNLVQVKSYDHEYTNELTSDDPLDGDTGERFVRFANTNGVDPNPEYHDVHFMADPEFMKTTWHGYPPKGWSPNLVQVKSSKEKTKEKKRKDDILGDYTGDRYVKFAGTYGREP